MSRNVVTVQNARQTVLEAMLPTDIERAGIINIFGKTLAEDVKTEFGMPASDLAAKDGYAVIASDTSGANRKVPKRLGVLSDSPASRRIEPRTVIRIRAGLPMPEGANAVIPLADAYRPTDEPEVAVFREMSAYENIQRAGSLIPKGEIVLRKGTLIGGLEMGLIASLGVPGVAVSRKPRIGIITTGADVVEIIENMRPGEIRNRLRYAYAGMVMEAGCDIGRLVHVRDGRIALEKALDSCSDCDAIIVAVGPSDKFDSAVLALRNIGLVRFERVQVEPGGSAAFATVNGRPTFVGTSDALLELFEVLIRPALLTMLGRQLIYRPAIRARLASTLRLNPGARHYLRAMMSREGDGFSAVPLGTYTSGSRYWTQPNALIVLPENVDLIKRGEMVDVRVLSFSTQ